VMGGSMLACYSISLDRIQASKNNERVTMHRSEQTLFFACQCDTLNKTHTYEEKTREIEFG